MQSDNRNQHQVVSCPGCGVDIDLQDNEEEFILCPYCGYVFRRSERLKDSGQGNNGPKDTFPYVSSVTIYALLLLIINGLFCLYCFTEGKIYPGVVSILVCLMYLCCLITGTEEGMKKDPKAHIVYFILGLILTVPMLRAIGD